MLFLLMTIHCLPMKMFISGPRNVSHKKKSSGMSCLTKKLINKNDKHRHASWNEKINRFHVFLLFFFFYLDV